jgi:hypothetical protein
VTLQLTKEKKKGDTAASAFSMPRHQPLNKKEFPHATLLWLESVVHLKACLGFFFFFLMNKVCLGLRYNKNYKLTNKS